MSRNWTVTLTCVLLTAGMLGACGDDDDNGNGTGNGAAGSNGSAGNGDELPVIPAGCIDADTSGSDDELHEAALNVLTGSACALSGCHGNNPSAQLSLNNLDDLVSLLGTAACQAPSMDLVDDSGGQAGLDNSYLWQKLAAEVDANHVLVEDSAFGESASCGQQADHPFGVRMPLGTTAGSFVLDPVRNWICAGAPTP